MVPAKQFKSIDIRYSELISLILFFEIVITYQAEMASARVRETSDLGDVLSENVLSAAVRCLSLVDCTTANTKVITDNTYGGNVANVSYY